MQNDGSPESHAKPVRAPEPTRALVRERAEFQRYRAECEGLERRSMLRGLILLAVVVLVASIARAGMERVFAPGWWRSCADCESQRLFDQNPAGANGGPARTAILRGRQG